MPFFIPGWWGYLTEGELWGWPVADESGLPLREQKAGFWSSYDKPAPGRRLRVFAGSMGNKFDSPGAFTPRFMPTLGTPTFICPALWEDHIPTFGELYDYLSTWDTAITAFASIPLTANGPAGWRPYLQPGEIHAADPSLHQLLQDLANEINEDIHEACFAIDDPDLWYPGVDDDSIPPVSDDHVDLVIWALQRELNREIRIHPSHDRARGSSDRRPAVVLANLPRRVQRALAERRRLRYQQYGIGQAEWEAQTWSLWKVPEDPDFIPRRALRIAAREAS